MGTFSPKDERALLLGFAAVVLGGAALVGCIGFAFYSLAQWVFA